MLPKRFKKLKINQSCLLVKAVVRALGMAIIDSTVTSTFTYTIMKGQTDQSTHERSLIKRVSITICRIMNHLRRKTNLFQPLIRKYSFKIFKLAIQLASVGNATVLKFSKKSCVLYYVIPRWKKDKF